MPTIFTSIPGRVTRLAAGKDVGKAYQKACLDSWKHAGFKVVSLNSRSERETIEGLFDDVRFVEIDGDRPKIRDFFEAAQSSGEMSVGIVNSDCLVVGSGIVADQIAENSTKRLLVSERHNVCPDTLTASGESCEGFDAFFFHSTLLDAIEWDAEFHIGEPFWDFWFPLSVLRSGHEVRSVLCPPVLHLDHPQRWSEEQYVRHGARMLKDFSFLKDDTGSAEDERQEIGMFGMNCVEHIRRNARPLDFDPVALVDIFATGYVNGADKSKYELSLMTDKIQDKEMKIKHLQSLLDKEIAKQKKLIAFVSRPVGEFLCALTERVRPRVSSKLGGALLDRTEEIGRNMQLAHRLRSVDNGTGS